jgi:hypothetical protein
MRIKGFGRMEALRIAARKAANPELKGKRSWLKLIQLTLNCGRLVKPCLPGNELQITMLRCGHNLTDKRRLKCLRKKKYRSLFKF